jgi:DNA repair photolyase
VIARAAYREMECRTALNKVSGMPFGWSLNPYRGCVHGCHYCFARRFHTYFDLNASEDLTGIVFVKTNVRRCCVKSYGCRAGITTLDENLARRLEPATAPPRQRLHAVEVLARAGIRVGVLLAPVVPGLTDDRGSLESVMRGAAAHGAQFVGSRVLELKEGTKDHFLGFIEREFPDLSADYRWMYPGA